MQENHHEEEEEDEDFGLGDMIDHLQWIIANQNLWDEEEDDEEEDVEGWYMWMDHLRRSQERMRLLNTPVHQKLECSRSASSPPDLEVLMHKISILPPELHVAILRHFDLESLLRLQLPPGLLQEVLQVPKEQEIGPWLARRLVKEDLGIIYIPEVNTMFMTNDEDSEEDVEEEEVDLGEPIGKRWADVSFLTPGLPSGAYKIRILKHGFDLVLLGRDFLTSQCGPLACFPTSSPDRYGRSGTWAWAGSFLARGFRWLLEIFSLHRFVQTGDGGQT